jgi:hypothetical protein
MYGYYGTLRTVLVYYRVGLSVIILLHKCVTFKGAVSRDFLPSVFHQSTPPRVLIHGLKPFLIWFRIRRDNLFENHQNQMRPWDPIFCLL